jgi:hypothetical protein
MTPIHLTSNVADQSTGEAPGPYLGKSSGARGWILGLGGDWWMLDLPG